jgi:hypothetical protein
LIGDWLGTTADNLVAEKRFESAGDKLVGDWFETPVGYFGDTMVEG